MACHQAISFHQWFLRVPKAEAVFWPGCALMTLDPVILERTLAVLRRAELGIRLAVGCCGQPTRYLFPDKLDRLDRLTGLLKRQGIRRIYTACPNCTLQLRECGDFEIIPIWPVLAAHLTAGEIPTPNGRFIWHDPCPTRGEPLQRQAARELLALSGCDVTEPGTIGCCGNIRMLRAREPEKSAAIRQKRLAQLETNRVILSNCEGCLDAFRSEGRETCHLLELLFGKSAKRNWGNRIQITMKASVK